MENKIEWRCKLFSINILSHSIQQFYILFNILKIIEEWFGRTIINSVVKLSYEHAQMFIEDPNREFKLEEFPSIRNEFNLNDIKRCVLDMDSVIF